VEGDATVSARDALSNALWDNYTRAQKNAFIDAFAHELAEQIRQDAASRWAPNGKGVYAVGVEEALEGQTRGAELIDPEAQKP
jgi:hypothetical protein